MREEIDPLRSGDWLDGPPARTAMPEQSTPEQQRFPAARAGGMRGGIRVRGRGRNRGGFTLLELMVAVAISAILLVGMVSLFVETKDTYRIQAGINSMHDQAQYAMNLLRHELSMAGHFGGGLPDQVALESVLPSGYRSNNCNSMHSTFRDRQVMGRARSYIAFNALNNLPTSFGSNLRCIGARELEEDTDFFAVRYFRANPLGRDDLEDGIPYGRGSTAGSGLIFWGADRFTPDVIADPALCILGTDGKCSDTEPESARTYAYHEAYYYVRPCSNPPPAPVGSPPVACSAAPDNDEIPTLARLILRGENYIEEGIAEGVENMQMYFGMDNNDDNIVDEFTNQPIENSDANGIVPNLGSIEDWHRVQQVQVELLVRSRDISLDLEAAGNVSYTFRDGEVENFTGDELRYQRRLFSVTVRLRNQNFIKGYSG